MRYHQQARFSTEPAAFGLLAGLGVLLAAAIAIGCGDGCVMYAPGAPSLPSAPRPLRVQPDTVVKVETFCIGVDPFRNNGEVQIFGGSGTGVILDARHLLTADHVVACPYLPDIHITTANGLRLHVIVTRENAKTDLALLEIASSETFGYIEPPIVGPRPEIGAVVCKLEAVPARGSECGTVIDINDDLDSDVGMDAPVQHGNSGGPVYDTHGRLVGITTQLIPPDGSTGGRFTSLSGREDVLP